MKKRELEKLNKAVGYLYSLEPKTLKELDEIVSVYNTDGESYADFTYGIPNTDFCIKGCFCKTDGKIEMSPSFTVLDIEQNVVLEIEWKE